MADFDHFADCDWRRTVCTCPLAPGLTAQQIADADSAPEDPRAQKVIARMQAEIDKERARYLAAESSREAAESRATRESQLADALAEALRGEHEHSAPGFPDLCRQCAALTQHKDARR